MAVDAQELVRRHASMLAARQPWDVAWADLAKHFLPTRYRDTSKRDNSRNPKLLNSSIVDSTGVLAIRTMAAGLHGGLTSPARPWFRLTTEDEDLAEAHGVRQWMDDVAKRMLSIFHKSNFYNAVHNVYGELGTFGTACMMELADFENGFRFIPFTAGEYCLDTDYTQRVDTVFRRFGMSSRQLVQMFGREKLPEYVISDFEKPGDTSETFTVVHAVYPRKDRDNERMGADNKPWASVYWLDNDNGSSSRSYTSGGAKILRESGFDEFPAFGPRWDVCGSDVYGRSPAMDVFPDCRMLQQMAITTLKAIHKAVDPPMSVKASLQSAGLDLRPGSANYVDTQPGEAPQAATPILQIRPEIQAARIAIQDVQIQIKEGLYNDLFRMLMGSSRSQITAREIAAREEEKLILIGPVLERLQGELFMPLTERTFGLMTRMDMLPAPPPELSGAPIKVEFVSLLAQAQKLVSTSSVDQMMAFTMNAAQAFPEVLDAIDPDKVMDEYCNFLGVPSNMVRPTQDRELIRQQRMQAQQAAEQQAQATQIVQGLKGSAETAQTLSETPMGAQNKTALDALLGGVTGA